MAQHKEGPRTKQEALVLLSEGGKRVYSRYASFNDSNTLAYLRDLKAAIDAMEGTADTLEEIDVFGNFSNSDREAFRFLIPSRNLSVKSARTYANKEQIRVSLWYNINIPAITEEGISPHDNADMLMIEAAYHGSIRVFPAQIRAGQFSAQTALLREFGEMEWRINPDLVPTYLHDLYSLRPAVQQPPKAK